MAGIAATNELNNRERFRNFFRTDPSTEFVGPAIAVMARQFNWTQMAIISQEESLFLMIANSLEMELKSDGRELDQSIILDTLKGFPYSQFRSLINNNNHRIIVLNLHEPNVYAAMCEAAHLGWYPPKYVWYSHSWLSGGWWNVSNGNSSCTLDMMRRIVNGSLAINPKNSFVSDDRQTATFSGLTPDEYESEYRMRLQREEYQRLNLTEFVSAGTEYDGIWAMALGLHYASERVRENDASGCEELTGHLVPLEEFDYGNDMMGCVLRNSFQQVNFTGITGPVMFNSNGSRNSREIRVQLYHISANGDGGRTTVVEVTVNSNSSELVFKKDMGVNSIWQGGAPYDGRARNWTQTNHAAFVSIYSIAAIVGIAYAVVCLVFNIVFRNMRIVKLSSRNLNFLIVAGAIILYTSVFLYIFLDHDIICNLRQAVFSLGYTLCFAVILAKTWRVYHIYFNPAPKKKLPKDWFLLVIIMLVVAGDLIIVLIGTTVPSSRYRVAYIPDQERQDQFEAEGIIYNNYVNVCLNSQAIVWLAISYAYKGLLQLVAMFMAFHTRKVKIKILNDSKMITVIVYINSIILTLLAVVEFALIRYHQVYTTLFGLALLVEATVFLSLIFVPMMVKLSRDPNSETVLNSSHIPNTSVVAESKDPTDDVEALKLRIAHLEKQLGQD